MTSYDNSHKKFYKVTNLRCFLCFSRVHGMFDPKYRDVIFLEPPLDLVSFFSKEMTTCLNLADSWKRSAK